MAEPIEAPTGFRLAGKVSAFDASCIALSPWAQHTFCWSNIQFDSTIRFLSWMKARHYGEDELAMEVIKAPAQRIAAELVQDLGDPADQAWNRRAIETVKLAYTQRFLDSPALIHLLASTFGTRIAFVSENDRWGTGQKGDAVDEPNLWSGENRLGLMMEELRDEYFRELTMLLNPTSTTLSQGDVEAVVERCTFYVNKAASVYPKEIPMPEIRFNMRGKMPSRSSVKMNRLSFNPILLMENWDDFVLEVIPHEVAHFVAGTVWGEKIQTHGGEWLAVMKQFGVEPRTSYDFSTVNAETKQEGRQIYGCQCHVQFVSASVHEEMQHEPRKCNVCEGTIRHHFSESDFLAYGQQESEPAAA